jgi:arginine:ornithine antiporter/lysine permease
VISTYWTRDAFTLMLNLTSVMNLIPFFLVSLYGFLVAKRGETYNVRPGERTRDLIIAGIAVIYTAFLIYAAGMKFLVLSAILYGPGTVLYFWTRREQNKKMFTPIEWVIFIVTIVLCIVGIHGLATGYITI